MVYEDGKRQAKPVQLVEHVLSVSDAEAFLRVHAVPVEMRATVLYYWECLAAATLKREWVPEDVMALEANVLELEAADHGC